MGTIKPFGEESLLSALKGANSFLLCTHVNPDGDAIGSALAMAMALRQMGKQVVVSCADPVPKQLRILPGASEIVGAEALQGRSFDAGFALDASEPRRLGACADAFFRCPVTLQIDHHGDNPRYAQHNAVDADAGATGCIVFRALRALDTTITREIAQCLYSALSTDTGNFCFSCTTGEIFAIMSELMEAGLDLTAMARSLHLLREESHVRMLGRALNSLRIFGDGKCAGMRLTAQDFAMCHALPEHTSKIVNYGLELPGVQLAYLLEEADDGSVKGSLRAQSPWDVSAIAHAFDGGGHALAAGFNTQGSLDEVSARLERTMLKCLEDKS